MAKVDLLVKNGEVWTPGGFIVADIAVSDGKIVALGKPPVLPESADTVIDAKGKKIIPGLIDTHTHHRDPGFTYKEDITTATMAAAAGGVTTSIGMPNVNPPTTTVERYRALIEHHSKNAIVDFNHNPSGTVPEEIPGLAKAGPLAFKIFMVKDTGRDYPHMPGIGINNNGELFKCFETVGSTGLPLMVHPHDQDLMDEIEGRYWKREDRSPQAYAKAYRDYDGIIWDTAMSTRFLVSTPICGHSDNRCLYYGGGCDTDTSNHIPQTELRAPAHDETIVMVNTDRYGGCGGERAVYSAANSSATEIAIHEMGHTAFALADEYPYYAGGSETGHDHHPATEPTEPNVTINTNRATLKWNWAVAAATAVPTMSNPSCGTVDSRPSPVPTGTVGLFEGAHYYHCGGFRPDPMHLGPCWRLHIASRRRYTLC